MASPKPFHLDSKTLGTEIVTIYVGPKRKTFSIHKKLICERSEFFSKAFNGRFQEAQGTMYLPDDDVGAFDSFTTYLYQDRLPHFDPVSYTTDFEMEKLYPLFFLAEKFCINELANKLMDAIQDFGLQHDILPSCADVIDAYRDTHETSRLRSYCVLMRLYDLHVPLEANVEQANDTADLASRLPEFASDLIRFQFKYRDRFQKGNIADAQKRDDKKGFGRCFFHTHAKGEICHLESAFHGSK